MDGSPALTYTYDTANRPMQTRDLVTQALVDYVYDDNGNLLDDGEKRHLNAQR